MLRFSLVGAAALALAALAPTPAEACGGFFCSSVPIDQSKERIVFAIDEGQGQVEVHVQIFYQGPSNEFAWVVPVPSVPEVGLSTDELFTQLDWRTAPQFWLQERQIGECEYDYYEYPTMEDGDFDDAESGGAGGGGDEVTVIDQSQVGPYDQVTLQASSTTALLDWLNENGYIIPADIGPALDPYVAGSAYFVALKLTKNMDAGDIAPIKMRYAASSAMIPLVLTSIAATPDMRLQPYILSTGKRAVPDNYLHVQINEAAIDWLSGGMNYDAVVTQAANEAGGQAFATDYAGPSSVMDRALYWDGRFNLARLASMTDPAEYAQEMLNQGFPRGAQVQELLRTYIPMPAELVALGVPESDFYNCLECYREYLDGIDFDPIAMTEAIDEVIVTPLKESQALIDSLPYMTRLTSSMSPDEMTLDPQFVLNGDMGDVSQAHQADLVVDCTTIKEYSEAPRRIELADGRQIIVPPASYYWDGLGGSYTEDLDVPAALVIEETSGSGQPTVVTDNNQATDDGLADFNEWAVDEMGWGASGSEEIKGSCGCSSTGSGGWTVLGLVGLLMARRRRG